MGREKKILKGLSTLDCDTQRLNINNMTPDEIEMWKVSFVESMNSFRKLKQDKKIASIGGTRTTAGSDTASRTAPSTSGAAKSRPQRQRRTSTTTSNAPDAAKRSSLFL